jgi:TatA/E family protein of Tat protein translocase
MFDIGLQELVVIFAIALLVFGPRRLPELGRALGRAMREFRRASDEFRSTFETNLMTEGPPPPPPPRARRPPRGPPRNPPR